MIEEKVLEIEEAIQSTVSVSTMQNQLIDAYNKLKSEHQLSDELAKRASAPLLLRVTQKWSSSTNRILVVGQETMGWNVKAHQQQPSIYSFKDFLATESSIDLMMQEYESFAFSEREKKHRNSPFWKAFRQIRKLVDDEVSGINSPVLWTNLFRMSLDDGSVIKNGTNGEIKEIRRAAAGLLSKEINILKPTAVVFFTGPDYDYSLREEFTDVKFIKFKNHRKDRTSHLEHSALPSRSMRTYHPGYLNRGHLDILNEVIAEVTGND